MLRSLHQFMDRRLKYKVIVPFLILAAITLLLLTALTFYTVANRLEAQLQRDLRKSATTTALELEYLEQELLDQLRIVINAPSSPTERLPSTSEAFAAADSASIDAILRKAADFFDLPRVIAFNAQGAVIVDVVRSDLPQPDVSLVGTLEISQQAPIRSALQGAADALGDKYATVLALPTDPLAPLFSVVAPIRDPDSNQIVGALLIAHPLDALVRDRLPERNGFNLTAILDRQGTVLASNSPGNNADLALDLSRLDYPEQTILDQRAFDDQSYQLLYSPLRIRRVIDGYIAIGQSRDTLIGTWADSRMVVFMIAFILLIGVLLLGSWVTTRITTPISALAANALAVQQGHFTRRSHIQRADEVGTLAHVLNNMTDRLIDLYYASRAVGAELSIGGVRQETIAALNRILPVKDALLFVARGERWVYISAAGVNAIEFPLDQAILDAIPDVYPMSSADDTVPGGNLLDGPALALPLRTQQHMVGMLLVSPEQYPDDLMPIREHLTAIASMAAAALYNAVLYANVQEEAAKQEAIVQSIADGVLVLDPARRILLANAAAEQFLQTPAAALRDAAFSALPLVPQEVHTELFAPTHAAQGSVYQIGHRILRLIQSSINSATGRVSGDVIVLHDITAEHAIDRAKTDFIATISHELRTPLTAIIGYSDLMGTGMAGPLSAMQTECLTVISRQTRAMNDLIQNMILIASIESGNIKPITQSYSAATLLAELANQHTQALTEKGLAFDLAVADDLPPICVDRDYMAIILNQLIRNARQHTDQGGITLRATLVGAMVQCDLHDTGRGIDEEDVPRLFRRFQRGGEQSGLASEERGAGLGLAIVKQLVEQLGGTIWMTSVLGQGTTVSWQVPCAA